MSDKSVCVYVVIKYENLNPHRLFLVAEVKSIQFHPGTINQSTVANVGLISVLKLNIITAPSILQPLEEFYRALLPP